MCNLTGPVSGKAMEVSGIRTANLSYCVVQKAGCTTWIRLFKFLNGQNRHTGTPLSIGKYEVHNVLNNLYQKLKFTAEDHQFIMTSLRAMTVRDPYTRLWSAYIDKLLLPDFWQTKGKMIIRLIRKQPSAKALECGFDVTFSEFIQYVISTGHSLQFINQDKHWLPASDICDPCTFKPEIINKQETFLSDLRYTLRKSNLTHMIDKLVSEDPIEYEIKDEINYNFKIHKFHERCISKFRLGNLLWIAMTLNGYIPVGERFPSDIYEESLNAESLFEMVKHIREKHNMTKQDTKLARKLALKTAYSQISYENMQKLRTLYKKDFQLFGYDSVPNFL